MTDATAAVRERPLRVQLSRKKGWRMPENTAKVDRSSLFGNPFRVTTGRVVGGEYREWTKVYFVGDRLEHGISKPEAMAKSVERFRQWAALPQQQKQRDLIRVGLRGKNLACWCALDQPCHADVLLEIANR